MHHEFNPSGTVMKKAMRIAAVGLLATASLLVLATPAVAHARVDWSVNIGVPGPVYYPPPVYYAPPPVVYAPRPVYVEPPPVYVEAYPQPYYGYPGYYRHRGYGWREHGWRRHHDH